MVTEKTCNLLEQHVDLPQEGENGWTSTKIIPIEKISTMSQGLSSFHFNEADTIKYVFGGIS